MATIDSRPLLIAFAAYTAATTLHFVHNAWFLETYPNMPDWISRAHVYGALACVVATGALGYALLRLGARTFGLIAIAAYAALGFDGLAHYGLAPVRAHSAAMNLTIWLEVGTAAVLLTFVAGLLAQRLATADKESR